MRKTDKKIDNQLRNVLTDICNDLLKEFPGFKWVTHIANYSNFPKSLKIICAFDNNTNLDAFNATNAPSTVSQLIQKELLAIGININDSHISYDTEASCNKNHNRKRENRFNTLSA